MSTASQDAFPDFLEAFRIPDYLLEDAYEVTSSSCRASIKTGIAIADFHFRHRIHREIREYSSPQLGFAENSANATARNAIVFLEHSYQACARLCAAVCLPVLTGVKNIAVIITGGKADPGILTTLELCGIEDIFQLDYQLVHPLLKSIHHDTRLTFLYGSQLETLAKDARQMGFKIYQEDRLPRLALLAPKLFDPAVLQFAHGLPLPETNISIDTSYSCVFIAPGMDMKNLKIDSGLFLESGCEGFWLHPGLDPTFYIASQKKFGFYTGD